MAVEKFGPHLKTILEAKHIEKIHELWEVDYAVEIELPGGGNTPENVRPGYCGAYALHFMDGGLSFPLPRFLLEALAELKMALGELGSWGVEEGLEFSLGELKQLFAIKRNSGFPGLMILAPRSGRVIIEGIPNRDDRLREKLFVFKINLASVGDFDFERIPREWSDDLEPFCPAPMTPELRGLMATLRRDIDSVVTDFDTNSDRAFNDKVDSLTHRRRRRVLEEINSVTSGSSSPGLSPPLRVFGEGTSQVNPDVPFSSVPEASSWSSSYENEIPILEIWRKIRAEGCGLPSLERVRERDAYLRMAVAKGKAMEASNEYAALMEGRLADFPSKEEIAGHLLKIQQLRGELEASREVERQREAEIQESKRKLAVAEAEKVAIQSDIDSMKEKHRREIEGRDRKARKDRHLARLSLARNYDGVLSVVKSKLEQKKKETAAEIRLQEVRACIEALTEYNEGGFELEAELERLKGLEILLEVDYGLASVSDHSLSHLDLPEIYGDSVNHFIEPVGLSFRRRRTETDQESVLWAFIWPDRKSVERAIFSD
ncbi:uncharacterized protein LOC106412630 [Brassica napus]|uniref:uncharacterized protein LOC106412630 n=1 Tax=Brassica napus TaxID=3708 RepID=UPI0006AAD48A|nr:uncharacterized protein LOC106412630 [Brassica napus]